jgi:hypothetical protein
MANQMTLEQFGQKVKAKYPQYASFSDTDIANKVIAKYPQYKSAIALPSVQGTPVPEEGLRDKLTEIQPHRFEERAEEFVKNPSAGAFVKDVAAEYGTALSNIGGGLLSIPLHPLATAESAFRMSPAGLLHDALSGKTSIYDEMWQAFKAQPLETAEQMTGQAAFTGAASEVVGPVTKGLMDTAKKAGGRIAETATGTGPKTTAELVKKVQAGNEAADAYSSVRARIETARQKALEVGNQKYAAVNPTLNPIEADPEFMEGALADAAGSLRGSHTEPTLLKNMEAKLQRGDAFTYEDLQGDYSRLGKELSKGTLPGDEFHAYDELHEAMGKEMGRIAAREDAAAVEKGEPNPNYEAKLTDARNYWRRMKQTFGKPLGQTDAATGVLRSAAPDVAEQDTLSNRVRLLGSFDAEIPAEFKRLSEAQEASKGAPKPAPGETGKVNERDIRAAKAAPIKKAAGLIRSVGYRMGLIWPVLDVIRDVVRGELPSLGGTVGGGLAIAGGSHAIASLVERPAVIKFLTRVTAQDIAEIPQDLIGDLKPIVQAADKQGVKVNPALAALVGVTLTPRGPKTRQLEQDRDEWYATHPR